jgi:hypothetical protein
VCSFIATLVENTYNEFGDVIIQEGFSFSTWRSSQQHFNLASSGVSPLQLVVLVLSTTTSLVLLIYSCYLTRKLLKRMPLSPTAKKKHYDPSEFYQSSVTAIRSAAGRVSSFDSGIMATRSANGEIIHGDMSYGSPRFQGDVSTLVPAHDGTFA